MHREWLKSGLPIAALAVIAAGYLWEVVSLSGVPVARDMQMFFVPQKRVLAEALSRLEVPLWTPLIGTGAPFLANVQSGVFYPPHWLYAALPFFAVFNLLLVFHLVLGGAFAFLLCRRLGVGPAAAFVGSAMWMFGGYFASLLNLVNALQGAAWAPGLAWAALRAAEARSRVSLVALVLVTACAALAGEPQSFLLAAGVTLITLILWWARNRPTGEESKALISRLVIAGAFALGLVMIQLLPTIEFLRESGRGGGLTYGEAVAFDLDPVRLVHLFVPPDYRDPEYAFGLRSIIGRGDPWLFSIYVGAAFPLLLAFACGDRSRRRDTRVWAALWIFGLLVALGENTPVFRWLFDYVPGFGSFRFPEKYFFVVAFSTTVLGAYGADRMFAGARHRADRALAALFVGIPLFCFGLFHVARAPIRSWAMRLGNDRMFEDFDYAFGIWSQNIGKWALLCALFVGLAWAFRRGSLSGRWFAILFCTLTVGDLVAAHRDLNPAVEPAFYEEEPLVLRHVPLETVQRDFRYRSSRFDSLAGTVPVVRGVPLEAQKWVWQQTMGPNVGQSWGVLQQDAWDAIKLRRFVDDRDLQRAIPDAGRRWKLLRLNSVRWVHSLIDIDTADAATAIPLDTLPGHLFELHDPVSRAYVVPTARRFPDPQSAINYLLSDGFDPGAAVVLIDPSAAVVDYPADSSRVIEAASIVEQTPHRVRVRVEADSAGWLVLTDSHYPGWRAEVDGEERPIELANFFFRGVRLRAGDQEVTFQYRSRPFALGRWLSLATIALGLGLLLAGRAVGRRRSLTGN